MTKRSSWGANPPSWSDFDRDSDRAGWLSYIDSCLDQLFKDEQEEAASRLNSASLELRNLLKAIESPLCDKEIDALLAGMTKHSNSDSRWKPLADIIRRGGMSIEMHEIIADLIEFGGFHPRANFDEVDTLSQYEFEIYSNIMTNSDVLRIIYPERNSSAILARAKSMVAYSMVDADPAISVDAAKRRVNRVTQGLESRPERAKFRLLRTRLENGNRFIVGRNRRSLRES